MTHVASWIAFAGLIVAVVACNHAFTEDATNYNLPIVQTAEPTCPKLANPCDRVNCDRPNTRIIA